MKKLLVVLAVSVGFLVGGCMRNGEEGKKMIYIADQVRVVILNSDLSWVDSFSAVPLRLVVDKDFIYVYAGAKLVKYNRQSPYAEVKQVDTPTFDDIDSDGNYIYCGRSNGTIQIRKKSDLSLSDSFDIGIDYLDGLVVDSTYIYCFEYDWIYKFKKSDHSLVDSQELTDPYAFWGTDKDDSYLYFCGGTAGESLVIHKKSDLSEYKVIPNLGQEHRGVCVQGDYAFMTDHTAHVVRKIKVSTGEQVATFGEQGVAGNDESHLNYPRGIAYYPSPPGPPTGLLCNGQTNPTGVT